MFCLIPTPYAHSGTYVHRVLCHPDATTSRMAPPFRARSGQASINLFVSGVPRVSYSKTRPLAELLRSHHVHALRTHSGMCACITHTHPPRILARKRRTCRDQLRTREAAGPGGSTGDADAKGGAQFAQAWPHSPHTGPQRLHMERKGPRLGLTAPSCLLGCICTISLKNQLSPLSASPRKGSGSPWMYCVQGL